jgi:F-box domain
MSGDPFKLLNEDTHRFILQHFDGNDVRKCSLVSRSWHELIGSSRMCMQKIVCRIDKPMQLMLIKNSSRNYENFKVTPYGFLRELTTLLESFYVKNIWINEVCDKEIDHSDYVRLIKSFSSTVEYLQIGDIATKNSNCPSIAIDFPMLKKLHCSFTNRAAFSILLGDNPKLTSAILSSDLIANDESEFLQHDNVIVKFLARNTKIKKLWLLHLEKLFLYDISSKVGKLTHFTFTTNFQNAPVHVKENFLKLLKTQGNFESLNVMGCRDKKILKEIWNSSIKFSKLFVIDCNFYEELSSFDLQRNAFVKEIDFYLTSSVHALFFLQAATNIKQYKVRQLSKQLLEFSLSQLKYLTIIKYQSIDMDAWKFFHEYRMMQNGSSLKVKLQELDFFDYLNIDKTQ